MRSSLRVGDVPAPSSVSMAVAGLPFQLTAASGRTCRQNSTNKHMTWLDFQAYFLPPHCKARRRQITAGRRAAVPGQSNATSFWRSVMVLALVFFLGWKDGRRRPWPFREAQVLPPGPLGNHRAYLRVY
jgi:hypothetical protein